MSAKTVAPAERVAIGITFGNSNSSIAVTIDDKAEVIANEDGDRQIPAILSYVDGEEYYGQQAKAFLVRNSKNTIGYFRDFLGKDFKDIDPTHNHASSHPVEAEGTIAFSVQDKEDDEKSTLPVSEVSTRLLKRIVSAASEYLGKTVTSAVITIPTNFTEKQKAALIATANAADIEVLQLIADPVAAVLAYDARPGAEIKDKIVVVADLGGTRSDVTVVASRGGMYTILATAHDYEFAGVQLDQVLIDHFAKEFQKKFSKDPRTNERGLAKFKLEAEACKKALSLGTNASFAVESVVDGLDFATTINRLRFEMLGRKVFDGFTRLITGVIAKVGLDALDIDEVIMSGGTSHVPRIANNLSGIFPKTTKIQAPATETTAINPSELSVRGAALQASLIQEFDPEDIEQSTHAAVTTVSHITNAIGVLSLDAKGKEVFTPILVPETAVPARRAVHLSAPAEGDFLVRIVEGTTEIKVTKPEPKPKAEKSEDDEDDEDEDDEDEEEEIREKEWKVGNTVAEAAIREVKKGGKIEVTLTVDANLNVVVTAREVGAKGGVRGTIFA